MQQEIADLVYPILSEGLAVKGRLARGEGLDLPSVQASFRQALRSDLEARQYVDFGSDTGSTAASATGERTATFLGIRYLLTCWLDELFILDSPWEAAWNERKLEVELFGTNDRAWRFWEQARLAELRPAGDALEVAYLCVALGFRGQLREDARRLTDWVQATRARVVASSRRGWTAPPDREPPTNVPPLRGRQRLQRMVVTGGIAVLVSIPIAVAVVTLGR